LQVLTRVQDAVAAIATANGRGVAQATKLLHLKRPALVPVIDGFVEVDVYLRSVGIERSLTRLLDCLIWCSEADAWVALSAVSGAGGQPDIARPSRRRRLRI